MIACRLKLTLLGLCCFSSSILADNPIVTHMFTADPTARVFENKVYIYPSTDVVCEEGFGNNGFCMPSYNVFSSSNLHDWQDHGTVVDQSDVPWGKKDGFGMWAPDAIERNGTYYFYFPDIPLDESGFRRIGVATAKSPEGPFTVQDNYIAGVSGIDPNVFIDDDGQAYLYFGGGEKLYVAKLKSNMVELASAPQEIEGLPAKYKEGPFLFKRNGVYYFTFPHSPSGSEELAYATGDNPLGPFKYQGMFMQRWRDGIWTNHHSIVEYENQWFLFYHHHQISQDQHLRSMRADALFFDNAGRIQAVIPTERGIGTPLATAKLQIDRYSMLSDKGVKASKTSGGLLPANWQVDWVENGSWLNYDRVNFEQGKSKKIMVQAASQTAGGTVQVRLGGPQGEIIGEVAISGTGGWKKWQTFEAPLKAKLTGIHNLSFVFLGAEEGYLFNIDWVSFK
ncbi:MAG: family 43 glycosylhydrolase [Paraglaciecola sp.]|uniref:family 43 glycosylhydrolase n=1 Tax=Paraglaciecola sp. TaxID=1920173 RepID=UPI003296939A